MLRRSEHNLDPNPTWGKPIGKILVADDCMEYFDQNGYDLTPLEERYALANGFPVRNMRWRRAVYRDWYYCERKAGVHLNHACLFERKGYHGLALEELKRYAERVPVVYKLLHMKPKWGIDMSIDYVDEDKAFEVFHYEWDDFDYNTVLERQELIEDVVENADWDDLAKRFWNMRDQWMHLDFDGQTKFKTDYLGLEPERFKLVAWKI